MACRRFADRCPQPVAHSQGRPAYAAARAGATLRPSVASGEAALASIDRLSTAGLPSSERFAFWRNVFANGQQSLAIEGEPESFEGVLTRLTDGELEIAS